MPPKSKRGRPRCPARPSSNSSPSGRSGSAATRRRGAATRAAASLPRESTPMTSAWIRAACTLVALGAACVAALPAAAQKSRQPLTLEPLGVTGEAIFPAYEGWGPVKDGSSVFLIGYYNRNNKESLDIPIGQNNRIEPGGPDYGQPTHFEPSREHGVFAIRVPKDFGSKKLTWTITANGQTSAV